MRTAAKGLLSCASACSIALLSAEASAAAVASGQITIDWNSVVIAADPGLTVAPDPIAGGAFANTASLQVSQATLGGVAVPNADLAPFSLFNQPVTVPLALSYNAGNALSGLQANLSTDAATASLNVQAHDGDASVLTGNFVNANVAHSLRRIVSGSGALKISFNYSMSLATTGNPAGDAANVLGIVNLGAQEFAPNLNGGLDFVGSFPDQFQKQLVLGDGPFSHSGSLSVDLSFTGATDNLVLLQMNAIGIPFANSFAEVGAPVPEPGSASLVLAGLGLAGITARRRRA